MIPEKARLKVLFCTRHFLPELGGVTILTDLLCRYLQADGCDITLATETVVKDADVVFPYKVLRRISPLALWQQMQAADCVVMEHLCIRHLLPLWLSGTPSLTVLQMDLETWTLKDALFSVFFKIHVRLGRHIAAISDALRIKVRGCQFTLPNPYNDLLFKPKEGIDLVAPEKLVFLGRLVSVKGVEFCIEALSILRQRGHFCDLTIIGDGPSLQSLKLQTAEMGLNNHVIFLGSKTPEELPDLLRTHGTLLIPSNYFEGFGLVAIEAISCGLHVIAFPRGGLPEAVGKAGLLCEDNTAAGLATKIEELIGNRSLQAQLRSAREDHLARFRTRAVGARYLEVLREITKRK